MGWIALLLLVGVVAAGYYGYRRLRQLEQEIRREIAAAETETETGQDSGTPDEPDQGLVERVQQQVRERAGLLQTELYELFPGEGRRALQELLRRLEREGTLVRTKEGGTYRLQLPSGR